MKRKLSIAFIASSGVVHGSLKEFTTDYPQITQITQISKREYRNETLRDCTKNFQTAFHKTPNAAVLNFDVFNLCNLRYLRINRLSK